MASKTKTVEQLRQTYARCQASAQASGLKGSFREECRDILDTLSPRPVNPTPEEWVWAATVVKQMWLDPADDERNETGPGIDEPWEVAYGPRCWESVYA